MRRSALSVVGQRVGFVEEDDFESRTAVGLGSRKLLHFGSNALQFTFVRGVHLQQVLAKVLAENVLGKGHRSRRFSGSGRTSEQQVGEVLVSGVVPRR